VSHILKSLVAYNCNGHVKNGGLLKITGSHVQSNSSNTSETVQDKEIVTPNH